MVEKGIVDSIIGQDIEMENIFVFMSDTVFNHNCCEEDEGNE